MDERPLTRGRPYLLKHRTGLVTTEIDGALELNAIAECQFTASRPLCLDRYAVERHLGSFIVIDPATGFTSAAGLVSATRVEQGAADRRPLPTATADQLARLARSAGSDDEAAVAVQRALEELFQ